ncbi:MAG: cation:proton antiporter [bacterium]
MNTLLIIGSILIIGIIGAALVRRIKLPSVAGWLIIGVILGPSVLKLISPELLDELGFISDIALGLIGVIIGLEITIGTLKKLGSGIISIILFESFGAFLLVLLGVYLLTHNLPLSLIFASLAPASAPAGTVAVLDEYKAKGPLTKALLVTVGADDALAIMIFVFASSYAKILISGEKLSVLVTIGKPLLEIILAVGIGGTIGWALGFFSQKIRTDEVLLPVSLGAILICVGLSKLMHFSLILANVVGGIILVNTFPRISIRISKNLESFIPPLYVCFFALAGAHLDLKLLLTLGVLGVVYTVCRSGGLIGGARIGAIIGKEPPVIKKYLGFGILSQAGVAVGLAYLVVREFVPLGAVGKGIATLAITTIAATTIIFEIIGPIGTKFAITKAGEIGRK